MHRFTRGFTLIELLAVLGFAVTLASIAIPGWTNAQRSMARDGAANNIQGRLQAARFEAIKRNQPVAFVWNGNEFEIRVKNNASSVTCANEAGDTVLDLVPVSKFQVNMNNGGGMMWTPQGLTRQCTSTANYAGTITLLENGSIVRQIVIGMAGRVEQR